MITEKKFKEIAYEAEAKGYYACGYHNICWEHACPCQAGMEDFNPNTYKAIQKEAEEISKQDW